MCEREIDKVNRPNKRRAVTLVQRLSTIIEKTVNLERNDHASVAVPCYRNTPLLRTVGLD